MKWHDWWWLWALENCLSGYCFIHTLALYCRQINDTLSISITSYSYMHPGSVRVAVSNMQVYELNLKHFWAFLSLSVGLLYTMTLVHEQPLCRQTRAWFFYSISATIYVYWSLDVWHTNHFKTVSSIVFHLFAFTGNLFQARLRSFQPHSAQLFRLFQHRSPHVDRFPVTNAFCCQHKYLQGDTTAACNDY